MKNSNFPETAAFAEELAELCDAPPAFRNLDVSDQLQPGRRPATQPPGETRAIRAHLHGSESRFRCCRFVNPTRTARRYTDSTIDTIVACSSVMERSMSV